MKKKIFALLMTATLVFGMSTTALADIDSPYWDNTPETDSPYWDNTPEEIPPVVDSPTIDNEPEVVGKVEIEWSEASSWTVDTQNVSVSGSAYEYDINVLKDGVYVGYDYKWVNPGEEISFDVSHLVAMNGAGKYTVEVYVYTYDAEEGYWITKYTGATEAKTYAKPATQLATPTNYSVDVKTGKITFDQVKDAEAYDVWIWQNEGSGEYKYRTVRVYDENTSDNKVEYTIEWLPMQMEDWAEGYKNSDVNIYVGVCAVSKDIDKVGYSDFAKQLIFENKLSKEEVKEKFENAFENVEENPYYVADVLTSVSNETIAEMIKTDAEFAKKVEKVEDLIIQDMGDRYKGVTSDTKLIDASKVKVVGAAINGRGYASVELTFAETAKKVEVDKKYENAVALEIELLLDGNAKSELNVPVTITMPIPAGVEKENLVILHYHGDAKEPVVIVPTVNADGTMTFIVEGFSTFVIANQVVEAPEAPDTGDVSGTTFICSLLLLAVGVVLVMKRISFAK